MQQLIILGIVGSFVLVVMIAFICKKVSERRNSLEYLIDHNIYLLEGLNDRLQETIKKLDDILIGENK